jgi:iron uptake system component EfeO
VADRASYEAGGITFKVSNKDATGITEFELLDGERILGEKENLPPGFAGSFSLNLNPGRYEMYCPGATTPRVPFTVTGTATSAPVTDTKALLNQGTASYGAYIEAQIGFLVTNVQPLVAAVKSGDLAAAKAAYAKARPYYERIEPVAESFQDLDPAIDARADDGLAPTKLTGFHRIEYGLWSASSIAGLAPVAGKLASDVGKLQKLATGLHYHRRSWPTARSGCSTRCRSRRSPARRSATRISTCWTSRPTSRAPSRRSRTSSRALRRSTRP